ncbi:Peptidyl-Lys metalloendopeptidase [Mycena kentingensis (nom. inval.)]|nr:Peptidyl-Lys metalloendopeptidase [Mycena kentingensis (nom. inval.)]
MFSASLRAALVALALSASATAAPGLSLSLTGPQEVTSVGALTVTATLVNTGDVELKLLNDPNTVLNTFETDSFSIADDTGASPTFKGAVVKYSPERVAANPTENSFTVLAPGASIEVSHDLSKAYNFTLSGESTYDIVASNVFTHVAEDGTLSTIRAEASDAGHTTALSGELAIARRTASHALEKRIGFQSCSSSRQTALVSAAAAAQTYANNAVSYITGQTTSSPRFTTWFGTFTAARRTTLLSHFTKMANRPYANYIYDCSCTDSDTFAFVFPDDPSTIYLCGVFWQVANTGTDSRGGTLIHESSHFTVTAGTDDHAYGQSAAKALAVSNPTQALDNADSHEYFAENNPVLA